MSVPKSLLMCFSVCVCMCVCQKLRTILNVSELTDLKGRLVHACSPGFNNNVSWNFDNETSLQVRILTCHHFYFHENILIDLVIPH